jgi:GxxExxY protein
MQDSQTTGEIINAAYEVHNALGAGFLEKVYENALARELELRGFHVEQQVALSVFYKSEKVGEYFADMIVNNEIILEIKAVSEIISAHEVQLVNYLTATKKDFGLILNFGPSVAIKRKYKNPLKSCPSC